MQIRCEKAEVGSVRASGVAVYRARIVEMQEAVGAGVLMIELSFILRNETKATVRILPSAAEQVAGLPIRGRAMAAQIKP
jgi:hypothetical protein